MWTLFELENLECKPLMEHVKASNDFLPIQEFYQIHKKKFDRSLKLGFIIKRYGKYFINGFPTIEVSCSLND